MSRRPAPIVATAAAAGLAVVLGAHAVSASPQASVTTAPPPSTTNPAAGSTTTTTSPGGSASTSTISPAVKESAVGAVENYGYGGISVKVTEKGGRITAVKVASLYTNDSYSAQLAQEAIPTLSQEVLASQSGDIAGVSGATYTSQGYQSSLQSALDKLHKK